MVRNRFLVVRSCVLLLASGIALTALGCASSVPRIPVSADPQSMEQLTGQWEGEYQSVESGRRGSITFSLSAGADTASGDVTMLLRPTVARRNNPDQPAGSESQPLSRTLSVTFVQATADTISGELDPYTDPDCSCTVLTVFNGRLEGDRIEGTYTSRSESVADMMVRGTWFVTRKKP